jgi:DNA topoisomerase-1
MLMNPRVDKSQMHAQEVGETRTAEGERIPPAWTDVWLANEKGFRTQAVGRDTLRSPKYPHGRFVYRYAKTHIKHAQEKKESRVSSFMPNIDKIRSRVSHDSHRGIPEAMVIDLLFITGLRVGSDKDTGAKTKAYGLSTLNNEHHRVVGNTVYLHFPAKKGSQGDKVFTDANLAKYFRKTEGKPNESTFHTSSKLINKYWHKITKKYLLKDIRTWYANKLTQELIKGMPIPTTIKQYKEQVKHVLKVVSEALNNTPTVAKNSYIFASNFKAWDDAVQGLKRK